MQIPNIDPTSGPLWASIAVVAYALRKLILQFRYKGPCTECRFAVQPPGSDTWVCRRRVKLDPVLNVLERDEVPCTVERNLWTGCGRAGRYFHER